VSDSTFWVGGAEMCAALKVPMQFPLVLMVVARFRQGKASGNEGGKALGSGLCYDWRS
jgi:hypothetical protein